MRSVIGVTGGSGGLGASTFAAALGAIGSAMLVDVDAAGGGIDVLLGIEDVAGARWSAVEVAGGRIDPERLRDGLPRWDAVPVLAADVSPGAEATDAVLDSARLLGPVVVDLGRGGSAARDATLAHCALVVVLVAADLPGVAAGRAAVAALAGRPTVVAVRRGCIEPDVAAELVGAPLTGVLPPVRRRAAGPVDARDLPRALTRLAAGIADAVPA